MPHAYGMDTRCFMMLEAMLTENYATYGTLYKR